MIIASIDIGTNTIILLIAEVNILNKTILPLYNEQRIPRIGEGLATEKPISNEKVRALVSILEDFNSILKKFNCEKTFIVATNALRIASNRNEITALIKKKFNFDINIVSGEEEADLTFKGAVFPYNDELSNIVIDVGGGSTEIIYGSIKKIIFKKSWPIGVVSVKEKYLKNSPPEQNEFNNFKNELDRVFLDFRGMNIQFKRVIAIAGTPTTLAAIKFNLKEYNEELLEGLVLNYKEIENLISELSVLKESEILKKYKSVVKGRQDVILSGAIILLYIMQLLRIDEVIVSTKGVRYGAIIKYLFQI